MKKASLIFMSSMYSLGIFAQGNVDKLPLKQGQKFSMNSNDSSAMAQKMGDQPMNMITLTSSITDFEVIGETKEGFILKSTLAKIKVDFDGFGQKMIYDSEDPKKQEGMMADQLKDKVGKSDTLNITFEGKIIEEKEVKGKEKGKGGMMRMMDQQSANIENAFLLLPKDVKVGQGWKADQTKDGVKTQTIYFLDAIDGDEAQVSFKRKKKGTKVVKGQQGEMAMEIDNLSAGMIKVSLSTGILKSYTEDADSQTKMNRMGQDMSTTGKTISTMQIK